MNRNRLRLTSLIATLSLLALVFSAWMQQPGQCSQLKAKNIHGQHVFCGSTSSSVSLVEIKPKVGGLTTAGTGGSMAHIGHLFPGKQACLAVRIMPTGDNPAVPLWLLNRVLLI